MYAPYPSHHHHVPCPLQSIGVTEAVTRLQSWFSCHSNAGSQCMNLEFVQGTGDSSPTLRKGHCGIFNIHQLMLADSTPRLTSIRGMAHTLMLLPALETLG